MSHDWPAWVREALADRAFARLATRSSDGDIGLVPVCFALVAGVVVSAVDHKPKRTGQLRRLDDVAETGRATLLVDHEDDDWSRLWWVKLSGPASVVSHDDPLDRAARDALVAKYRQYREQPPTGAVLAVVPERVRWWRADEGDRPSGSR